MRKKKSPFFALLVGAMLFSGAGVESAKLQSCRREMKFQLSPVGN